MSFAWVTYAIAVVWWPYSLYWWRQGRLRFIERAKAMPQDQRRGWLASQRTLLRSLRILLLIFPFAGVLLGVMTAPEGPWDAFLFAVSQALTWLATLDLYMRTRHMLREAGEPELSQVAVGTTELPYDAQKELHRQTGNIWFGVAAASFMAAGSYVLWLISEGWGEPREVRLFVGIMVGISTLIGALIAIRMFNRNSMPRSYTAEPLPPAPSPRPADEPLLPAEGPRSSGFGLVVVAALLIAAVVLMSVWRMMS